MIAAIPTSYRGVTFRSRLEARWAVFYDALGVEWHYEHEGYQLSSGWYLPDFWLPNVNGGCFVEIKPEPGHGEEHCRALANASSRTVFLFHGEVTCPAERSGYELSSAQFTPGDGGDIAYWWCECPKCGRVGIQFDGRGARVCGASCYPNGEYKEYSAESPRLLAAYGQARARRFW
jgi:hypothetical protein